MSYLEARNDQFAENVIVKWKLFAETFKETRLIRADIEQSSGFILGASREGKSIWMECNAE